MLMVTRWSKRVVAKAALTTLRHRILLPFTIPKDGLTSFTCTQSPSKGFSSIETYVPMRHRCLGQSSSSKGTAMPASKDDLRKLARGRMSNHQASNL